MKEQLSLGRAMLGVHNTIKQEVLEVLKIRPMTADEIAEEIEKTPFAVRRRVMELFKQGLIEQSGIERLNESLKPATVWRIKSV